MIILLGLAAKLTGEDESSSSAEETEERCRFIAAESSRHFFENLKFYEYMQVVAELLGTFILMFCICVNTDIHIFSNRCYFNNTKYICKNAFQSNVR